MDMIENVLKDVYNACDPYEAAGSAYYLDCGTARGSSSFVSDFLRHLELADDQICFLFTGHIGCGKSSELERLRSHLATKKVGGRWYFPILLDAHEYLDEYDVDVNDLFLAIVTELGQALREKKVELRESYFTNRLNALKSFFFTEVEITEGEANLFGVKAKIAGLKRDREARHLARDALNPQPGRVLDELNSLFGEALVALNKNKPGRRTYKDFVLIVDNMEKIRKVGDNTEGIASHRELFIERAPQLTGLTSHVVYTVPLPLARQLGPQLGSRYDKEPFVLPMVKLAERTGAPYNAGVDCLREILCKRLRDHKLHEVFEEDALAFLLEYCGGHIRQLMMFIQNACAYTDSPPIKLDAAHKSIQQTVRTYSFAIPENHWEKLARLDVSDRQKIENRDTDYLEMLENLSVLEYINGGGEDPFSSTEAWYAVHPIVRQLENFKQAMEKAQP